MLPLYVQSKQSLHAKEDDLDRPLLLHGNIQSTYNVIHISATSSLSLSTYSVTVLSRQR